MNEDILEVKCVRDAFAWATSEEAAEPPDNYYCPTRDILNARLEHLRKDIVQHGTDEEMSFLLHAVLSEIGDNVFDHNLGQWKDISGCIMTNGIYESLNIIVIADRGQGILKTLQRVLADISTHEEALKVAFTKRISGRAPEHRGNGLKFVRKVLLEDGIDLLFISGSAQYQIQGKLEKWSKARMSVPGCLAAVSFT